ncbi:MAG TPA: hypothetical protein VK718_08050 [Ferruginibacter sp.]|jgi:hypothetical protein|nr:hypothetical protein [Ferruginibacter sp.]
MQQIIKNVLIGVALLCFSVSVKAQVTTKDFKLYIDSLGCSDTTVRITKDALLHAKKVTANFPWLTIRSIYIYTGEGNYTSEIVSIVNQGNILSDSTKKWLERLEPGNTLSININGYNKQGKSVDWNPLYIIIK